MKIGDKRVTVVEMLCETDFVARTDKFKQAVQAMTNTFHSMTLAGNLTQKDMIE